MKTDPEDPDVGVRVYCVRDVDEPDLGIREFPATTANTLKARGSGDLWTAASQEIQESIDLEDHVDETVATVTIDVDAWTVQLDWEIDDVQPKSLLGRAWAAFNRFLRGGSA